MGGKKKGTANKLAKMSDEERAKYMQHKADQEEEARRRKEQLIITFMKNKVKREEAFSRLNVAKINQQWHHVLRTAKCKEMKENGEHLKKWIERVLALKNNAIDNLMKELDEAEFQYSNNLQAHLQHIDTIIEFYKKYMEQLRVTYEEDRDLLLEENSSEISRYLDRWRKELDHVKTVVYGQEVTGAAEVKRAHDDYLQKKEEYIKTCRAEINNLRKLREQESSDIWDNIASTVRGYVEQTDKRRAHLAELRRLDAESAAEISSNQERINLEEAHVEKLEQENASLTTSRQETIKRLQETAKHLNKVLIRMKQDVTSGVNLDEKRLRQLVDNWNRTMRYLRDLIAKGEHILNLAQSCRKYETQAEKITRWANFAEDDDDDDDGSTAGPSERPETGESNADADSKMIVKYIPKPDVSDVSSLSSSTGSGDEEAVFDLLQKRGTAQKFKSLIDRRFRQKTLPERRPSRKLGEKAKQQIEMISPMSGRNVKKVTISEPVKFRRGHPNENLSLPLLDNGKGSTVVEESVESLCKLDGLWQMFSKVHVECLELKQEKKALLEENEMLKKSIREALENIVTENNFNNQIIAYKGERGSAPSVYVI